MTTTEPPPRIPALPARRHLVPRGSRRATRRPAGCSRFPHRVRRQRRLRRVVRPRPADDNSGVVRDWNLHAANALINAPTASIPGAGQPPQVSALHLAMVHGAVYDAVNAIDGGHQPYLAGLPAASPSASQEAAVATAAHHVLVGLGIGPVPALPQVVRDRLDALYADALAGIADGAAKTDGIAAGAAAAAADAGRADPPTAGTSRSRSRPALEAGQWRPAPPGLGSDPFAWVANVQPFVLESPSQFQSQGPLDLGSRTYAKEYNEVKELGSAGQPSHRQAGRDRPLLHRPSRGVVQPHVPRDRGGARPEPRRGGPALRDVEHGRGGRL